MIRKSRFTSGSPFSTTLYNIIWWLKPLPPLEEGPAHWLIKIYITKTADTVWFKRTTPWIFYSCLVSLPRFCATFEWITPVDCSGVSAVQKHLYDFSNWMRQDRLGIYGHVNIQIIEDDNFCCKRLCHRHSFCDVKVIDKAKNIWTFTPMQTPIGLKRIVFRNRPVCILHLHEIMQNKHGKALHRYYEKC